MKFRMAIVLSIVVGFLVAAWSYYAFVKARFLEAVCRHDLDGIRRYVDMWPGVVNSTGVHRAAAIHRAVERGDVEMISLLIECGANVNQAALYSGMPLHIAAGRQSDPEIIRVLLDAGAKIEGRSPYATGHGSTALHYACSARRVPNIKALLKQGADPNARDRNGYAPLHGVVTAASKHDDRAVEAISMLLNAGADVNAKSKRGETALSMMTADDPRGKRERMREFLLSHGAIP